METLRIQSEYEKERAEREAKIKRRRKEKLRRKHNAKLRKLKK